MDNVLKIEGKKSVIINPDLNLEIGLFISGMYKDNRYILKNISAVGSKEDISLAVLKFDLKNGKYTKDGLNDIELTTTFEGKYRAIGINHISEIGPKNFKFYSMGDDLKIIVDSNAEEAINSIKDYKYEIEQAKPGKDIPNDFFWLSNKYELMFI